MSLIEAFVRNRVKVTVGVLLVALFGVIAVLRMPTQLTPEVQIPTITVETRWPGASPQEVEREVILEQEEQLKGVEGVTKMTSEAMDSSARITMEFSVGTDMSEALLLVNTRLQQVREYPQEADEPVVSTSNLSDRPIAWFILSQRRPDEEKVRAYAAEHPEARGVIAHALSAGNAALEMRRLKEASTTFEGLAELLPPDLEVPKMRRFAEDVIEARFERVEGVSNSNVNGGEEEEMQVIVDPQKLAARRLTITDVRQALRAENKDTSAGDLWEGKRRYVIRTLGQFRSPEHVGRVIIANRTGVPVYVRDVAQVRLGYKKPDGMVRRYGTSTIAINAIRDTGANVLDVMEGLREATRELNDGPLRDQGLELYQVYDETDYIYSAIGLVQDNIVVGGILTIAVLLLFLKSGRSTLVIGLAIPTSIIGTFLILSLMGRSLNVISLAGLAFAVGMLVDNAVVVLENIYQHYQRGEGVLKSAVKGAQEVWGAVVASTLTTLAVFLPVLFVQEEAGQLFRDIALAISSAVGLSLIVSIIVIPTAAAAILREGNQSRPTGGDGKDSIHINGNRRGVSQTGSGGHGPTLRALGRVGHWVRIALLGPIDLLGVGFSRSVVGLNAWLQKGVLRRLVAVGLLVGSSIYLSYLLIPKVEYLPTGNRNLVIGILLPPPGYNINMLKDLGEQIEEELRPYWDYDRRVPPKAGEPRISDFFYVARGRQLFLGLRSADPLNAGALVPLVRQVGGKIPGMFVVAKQSSLFEQGLTAGRTIDIEIVGPDLEKLVGFGSRILGQVKGLMKDAQVRPVPSLDLSSPEIHIVPKREQAAEMRVNSTDLGYVVDALNDGALAGDYYLGGDKIDLTILGSPEFATRTQDLASLAVATPEGDLVPLEALASVALASGPEQINHRERQRAITIEVTPPPEVALEDAMGMIRTEILDPIRASGELEGGAYQINLAGTADKLQATWEALRFNVLLALLITYLLMAALFESWLYPFVIILSVPLGAVGGFAGLWLLNQFLLQPLDVLTMLGFVILIGTVVNNPILIVHQALIHIREDGMGVVDAVTESVRTRIRPIFMTTSTTVLGLLPLVLFPGAGSELYRGLGSVMLGGLVVSTIFTLFLVPSLFTLCLDAKVGAARLFRFRGSAERSKEAEFAGESLADPESTPTRDRDEVSVGS